MLGFGEGEGREIEKREDNKGLHFGGRRRLVLYLLGFGKDFFFPFIYFISFGFRFFFFKYCTDVENCGSFRWFGYIYIYIY